MATQIVKLLLSDGKEILVESDDTPAVGVKAVGLAPGGRIDLAAALDNIKQAAEELRNTLQKIAVPPDSCEISFGVKLSASAGVVLAKAETEANFGITMSWSSKNK